MNQILALCIIIGTKFYLISTCIIIVMHWNHVDSPKHNTIRWKQWFIGAICTLISTSFWIIILLSVGKEIAPVSEVQDVINHIVAIFLSIFIVAAHALALYCYYSARDERSESMF